MEDPLGLLSSKIHIFLGENCSKWSRSSSQPWLREGGNASWWFGGGGMESSKGAFPWEKMWEKTLGGQHSSWLLYTVQRHFFIHLQLFSWERQWSGGT